MIAVDTNILVYAHRRDSDHHTEARKVVADLAEGAATWAIPWPCLHEFFSVTTHPRIYAPPSTPTQAISQVEAWLGSPSLTLIGETARHWRDLRELLEAGEVVGPGVHDARIAAICRAHRVTELLSADRDFRRFSRLKVRDPLRRAPGRAGSGSRDVRRRASRS